MMLNNFSCIKNTKIKKTLLYYHTCMYEFPSRNTGIQEFSYTIR